MRSYLIFFVLVFFSGLVYAQNATLSSRLQEKLDDSSDDYLHISILLSDRIDVLELESSLVKQSFDLEKRAELIIRALQEKATSTQADVLQFLNNNEDVLPSSVNSYWLANMVYAKVKPAMINELQKRNDIERIDLNGKLELVNDLSLSACAAGVPNGVEPGLLAINADELWKLGYTGRGRFALGADTGIDPSHPAIRGQYRGLYFDDSQTWYHWENFSREPYDCDNHGTHTVGTIMGLDRLTNDTIGVAPNASYIGANIIVCSQTGGSQDNIASFQWSVDPDGDPSTTDDIPDAINNSWNDREAGACSPEYTDVFQAMEAVGIAVVFAAGNDGPDPSTHTFPKNINYDEVNCFAVGALDAATESLNIAGFSSRGPSLCGGTGSLAIKPEVSAPGVNVRSCIVGGDYAEFSGTSMAAPHVVGAILLLKEAFPNLTGRELKFALYNTCTDLGAPGEDNVYGQGIIDVKRAFDHLIAQGNQPVDPNLERDVVLYHLDQSSSGCTSNFDPEILVENLGVETISSLNILVEITELNWDTTIVWNGELLPGGRTGIQMLDLEIAPGYYAYSAEITSLNGESDQYVFNNRLESTFEVYPPIELTAGIQDQTSNIYCKNSAVELLAQLDNYQLSSNEEIQWFDAFQEGHRVGSGESYTTPPLFSSRSYYAQVITKESVGPENNDMGQTELIQDVAGGIRFDSRALILKSVKIYLEKTGLITIVLLDQAGNTLELKQQVITQQGEHIVELDFDVPKGKNMSLEIRGLTMPLINTEGASFPYHLPGGLILKENTIANSENAYYCFYDWQVDIPLSCERTEVEVPITGLRSDFSVSNSDVSITDPMVEFFNESVDAESYRWNFGDGMTSGESDPQHIYQDPGEYEVRLISDDAHDCSDTSFQTITVSDTTSSVIENIRPSSLLVYPNPVSSTINVQGDLSSGTPILVMNKLGQVVLEQMPASNAAELHIEHLPHGVYFVHHEDKIVPFVKID